MSPPLVIEGVEAGMSPVWPTEQREKFARKLWGHFPPQLEKGIRGKGSFFAVSFSVALYTWSQAVHLRVVAAILANLRKANSQALIHLVAAYPCFPLDSLRDLYCMRWYFTLFLAAQSSQILHFQLGIWLEIELTLPSFSL